MRCWHSSLALKLLLLFFCFGDPTAVGSRAEGQKNGHISVDCYCFFHGLLVSLYATSLYGFVSLNAKRLALTFSYFELMPTCFLVW
jgi:hypothetical protein